MPGAKEMTEAIQQAKAMAIWATAQGGKVDLHVGIECADAGAAQQMTTKMQADGPKQMQAAGAMVAFLPGIPGSVKTLVEEAKNSLKYSTDGALAVTSVQFNVSTLEALVAEAAKMPGMGGPGAAPMPPQPPGAPPAAPGGPRGGPGGGRGGRGKGGGRP
jgi:hypothetical protein